MAPGGPLRAAALALLVSAAALAGCVANDLGIDVNIVQAEEGALVVDAAGEPVPFASVTAFGPGKIVLAILSADHEGHLPIATIPAAAAEILVTSPSRGSWYGPASPLPATIRLSGDDAPAMDDGVPALRFLESLTLGGAYLAKLAQSCAVYNCGASEPVIEVAGDGTIYVSGTCCIGESPPIWVSRDGGVTFEILRGDVLRDGFGIEGDFAIDDAGNLYFSDISAANAWFASWDKDGKHRWTVPLGPFVPLVDRPWIRAGAENVVYFLYNTGTSTMFYKSTDGGLTWIPKHQFAGNLGNLGQGPARDTLWVVAGRQLYTSADGGESWSAGERVPLPGDGRNFQAVFVPVVDEAGNVWVVYDWSLAGEEHYHVYAARRDAGGAWHGPHRVSPDVGSHHLPWAATGRDGSLVVAWYGTLDDAKGPNQVAADAEWFVLAAASLDATADSPNFQIALADPEPVHVGPMNRKLLDFLQIDVGPDGVVHLAYAQDRGGRPDELTMYVRTTTGLDFAPAAYPNGPW